MRMKLKDTFKNIEVTNTCTHTHFPGRKSKSSKHPDRWPSRQQQFGSCCSPCVKTGVRLSYKLSFQWIILCNQQPAVLWIDLLVQCHAAAYDWLLCSSPEALQTLIRVSLKQTLPGWSLSQACYHWGGGARKVDSHTKNAGVLSIHFSRCLLEGWCNIWFCSEFWMEKRIKSWKVTSSCA